MAIELVSPCHREPLGIAHVSELDVRFQEDAEYLPEGGRWWLTPQCCGESYKTVEEALKALKRYREQVIAASVTHAREALARENESREWALQYELDEFVETQKH